MAKIDWRGIAFGVVLGILGQSIYDTFYYLFSGQFLEEYKVSAAGLITTAILLMMFHYLGYLKEKK